MKPGDWFCPKCKGHIFASKKYCRICNIDKNGVAGNSTTRTDGWICPNTSCRDFQFNRNTHCRKCNTQKPLHLHTTKKHTALQNKIGDWLCPSCAAHQFAKNTECYKCKSPKPNSSQSTNDDNDDKLCNICLDNEKCMLLYHTNSEDGHLCCCQTCAHILVANNAPCPMCRNPVKQAIRVY